MTAEALIKNKPDTYTLAVGKVGVERLDLQHEIIGEDSREHLRRSGLKQGMQVIDFGCGAGSMAIWVAQQVGNSGRVYAVDASREQIAFAIQKADALGLNNIEFINNDVLDFDTDNESVDLVNMRCILMHLKQPSTLIEKARRYLRKSGILVSQEPVTSSAHSIPHDSLFDNLNNVLMKMSDAKGVDFDLGNSVHQLLSASGFENVGLYFTQPAVDMAVMKNLLSTGIRECQPAAIETGASTSAQIDRWYEDILRLGETEGKYMLPKQAHVTGYKY